MAANPVKRGKNRNPQVNRNRCLYAAVLLWGIVTLTSCLAPQQIFMAEINEFGWPTDQEVMVEFSNTDTLSMRSLNIIIRYGNEFPSEPLDLSITTVTPDGYRWIDTLSVPAPQQRSAYGLYQDIEQPYRRQTLLNRYGQYVFVFRPLSPKQEIQGVASIGIDIRPEQAPEEKNDF